MTQRALNILGAGGPRAYTDAVAALREDTRSYWNECLADPPDDGLAYAATPQALQAWINRHWKEWYESPITQLEHCDVIRDQALGTAYGASRWEMVTRYEVHLDRKLEWTLAMLVRLKELRSDTVPC